MTILPPPDPSQRNEGPRKHEHLYHVIISGDGSVIMHWCLSCPESRIIERGKDGKFEKQWQRIKEEHEQ